MIKVSVVVVCYNARNDIKECIESLLDQTYSHNLYEILFIDNNSNDGTQAIIKKYASAYSRILSSKSFIHHVYIDGFCGAGRHLSKDGSRIISGSPLTVLKVKPPFEEYYFIDMDPKKVVYLKRQVGNRKNAN